ncbi:MAG: peptidylprolyl isomerase [Abditibacteriota bacterium]|nr:peptidylprolyl isomerase [Abditibacteriota bacterium]MBP5739248.1 peptidylprolyl isomerase [Abditibacteriota bacterium]
MKKFGLWAIIIAALGILMAVNSFMGTSPDGDHRDHDHEEEAAEETAAPAKMPEALPAQSDKASMELGRVAEINTTKGKIVIVFFEKDCPATCDQIISLFKDNKYRDVKFGRVEKDNLIQIDAVEPDAPKLKLEVKEGLDNVKGAVGMARIPDDKDSATSAFYILMEPWRHLDGDYCVFARVLEGMDVIMKITPEDKVTGSTIRNRTDKDKQRFDELRTMEAEREVE